MDILFYIKAFLAILAPVSCVLFHRNSNAAHDCTFKIGKLRQKEDTAPGTGSDSFASMGGLDQVDELEKQKAKSSIFSGIGLYSAVISSLLFGGVISPDVKSVFVQAKNRIQGIDSAADAEQARLQQQRVQEAARRASEDKQDEIADDDAINVLLDNIEKVTWVGKKMTFPPLEAPWRWYVIDAGEYVRIRRGTHRVKDHTVDELEVYVGDGIKRATKPTIVEQSTSQVQGNTQSRAPALDGQVIDLGPSEAGKAADEEEEEETFFAPIEAPDVIIRDNAPQEGGEE